MHKPAVPETNRYTKGTFVSVPGVSKVAPVRAMDGKEVSALFISVIVPVRNEARFIERTLAQLERQEYDPLRFEIIVVDGESTDGTPALVEKFAAEHANVRLFSNPKRLSSAARNIAVRASRGDVVLLVDGHCDLPNVRCLSELADAFVRSGADCLGRPQPQDIVPATALQRAIAAARSSRLGHHPDSYIYSSKECFVPAKSVAVAYRREVFEKLGGFDERFDACEDVEFNHRVDRAGLRCFFTPGIAAHYAPRGTLRGLFRQLFRYGRGRVRLARKHPETLSFATLVPALFVAGCVLGAAAACLSWWLSVAYLAALAAYLTAILVGAGAVAGARRDLAILPWLPLVLATIHWGSGAGLLWESLVGWRRAAAVPTSVEERGCAVRLASGACEAPSRGLASAGPPCAAMDRDGGPALAEARWSRPATCPVNKQGD